MAPIRVPSALPATLADGMGVEPPRSRMALEGLGRFGAKAVGAVGLGFRLWEL